MVEFLDAASERMAQLEREDLELYQRGRLGNSSDLYHNETPDHGNEFQSKLPVLLDMVREIIDGLKQKTFSIENGADEVTSSIKNRSEPSMMNPQTVSTVFYAVDCDEPQTKEVYVVDNLPDADEMKDFHDLKAPGSSNSEEMLESEEAVVLNVGPKRACKVLAEMTESILEEDLLSIEVRTDAHFLLDERPTLFPVDSDEGLCGTNKHSLSPYPYIIEAVLGQNAMKKDDEMPLTFQVDAKNEQLMVTYIRGTSIAGLQGMNGMLMFIFDPGINYFPPMVGATLKSSEVPGSFVALCFAKVLLCFNLVGCCLFQNGCAYSEFNVDQGDCCLDISIYVLRDKAILHKLSIWIAPLGGVILLTDHILSRNGLIDIDSVAGLHVDKAPLGTFTYMLDTANDKSNEVFVLFSNSSRYITQALGYKGVVLRVSFSNFPFMSRLEPNLQVVDPCTGANEGQLNENICQRNLYGSLSFPSKVYSVYTTSDQASSRLNNGHETSAGTTKVHFTAADMLSQRVDKYCFIDFSHFLMVMNDSPAIIYLVSDSIAQGVRFSKSLFEVASSNLLSTLLSCWTMFLDSLTNELGFMSSFESRISLLPPLKVNFIWDPGRDAISFYIIENNDVLKRKGIWIQLACTLIQDDVKFSMLAMQMTQMQHLVEYGGYPYDHGSYTIMASENSCHANLYPSSNVAYTNVVQGDVNGEVQNRKSLGTWLQIRNKDSGCCCELVNMKRFVWDPGLQMSMEEESDQHFGFWFGDKVLCVCPTSALVLSWFPVSCDSYSMWQYYIKMKGQTITTALMLLFSTAVIFGISRFMLCAFLPYPNALAGLHDGIYKCNEGAATSQMIYGIPVFVFQPP